MQRRTFILAPLASPPALRAAEPVKVGFLVKQAEEPWFQDEWKFAEAAAKDMGFMLLKFGVPDAARTLAAIDDLAAQRAVGFVICAPDVTLGEVIKRAAQRRNLKVMSVDDQLVDGTGKPIADIPHRGISAYEIGKQVGAGLLAEIKTRGWKLDEVGVLRVAYDQLPTGRDRTTGAADALRAGGVPAASVVDAAQTKTDTESAFNAASSSFARHARFKKWVTFGLNDEAVLGAVRAGEELGIKADSMVAIGIGGSQTALDEFAKTTPTAFFGTVLISPRRHGYDTAAAVFEWATKGKRPPPLRLTSGVLMTRQNQAEMRRQMGL